MRHVLTTPRQTVRGFLTLALLLPGAAIGFPTEPPPSSAYGTQDQSVEIFPSYVFNTFNNMGFESVGEAYLASATSFNAGVQLPDGALVEAIEVEACDPADDGWVSAGLFSCGPTAADECVVVADLEGVIFTGVVETPGCDRFGLVYDTPLTVDNRSHTLILFVNTLAGTSEATSFRAGRIFWRRQVSPAPETATFGDVPMSHLFFRQIEALAASGITGGCGGSDFCPGAPLTRGQMAAFMAKALGLHWGEVPQD